MEVGAHHLALVGGEFGTVAADTPIDQAAHAERAVQATPVHEAGAAAARNLDNLGAGIAGALEAHGLGAGAGGAVFGPIVRPRQRGGLDIG